MSAVTSIEWTDRSWNPVRGCSRVSAGCENCYAERVAHRFSGRGQPYEGLTVLGKHGPRWAGRARFVPEMLGEPLRWRKPSRVFVNSMSDLFHEDVTDEQIAAVFGVMAAAPRHTFQVLTKRPERMQRWFAWHAKQAAFGSEEYWAKWRICEREAFEHLPDLPAAGCLSQWPLLNVWLGVSCENQEEADERISTLLDCPAAVRFISAEPLLEELSLFAFLPGAKRDECLTILNQGVDPKTPALDWAIVGGESGPGARACNVDWIRSILRQCAFARVPCFVKQLGARYCDTLNAIGGKQTEPAPAYGPITNLKDSKGGDPSEWPADLRVRQFPEVRS